MDEGGQRVQLPIINKFWRYNGQHGEYFLKFQKKSYMKT